MSDSDERRRAPRTRSNLTIEICALGSPLIEGVGKLLNLSETGLSFESTLKLAKDQNLEAHIRLEDQSLMMFPMKVVWVKSRGMGFSYGAHFLHPTSFELEKLQQWVKSQSK